MLTSVSEFIYKLIYVNFYFLKIETASEEFTHAFIILGLLSDLYVNYW